MRPMGWKLLFLAGLFALGMHLAGYSIEDVRKGATSLGDSNAAAVSPGSANKSDWGDGG